MDNDRLIDSLLRRTSHVPGGHPRSIDTSARGERSIHQGRVLGDGEGGGRGEE